MSDVVVAKVREARKDGSWKESEVRVLREAAKLEVVHYFRALKAFRENMVVNSNDRKKVDKLLNDVAGMRDEIILEIMLGKSVIEAFRECCYGLSDSKILFENSEIIHAS